MQRLLPKHDLTTEAVRALRELWEILRRKKGCAFHRLYRPAGGGETWLNCSEWDSLAELGGARRELARSPLYRRLHGMLEGSSERAYEPFGTMRSIRGLGPTAAPALLLIEFESPPTQPEEDLSFLREAPGCVWHLLVREIGSGEVLCLASFENEADALRARDALPTQATLSNLAPSAALFTL